MKRLLILMVGVMVAFVSCQKDSSLGGRVSGEEVSVTLSATMGDGSAISRSSGDGESVNRCILEIYCDGTRLTRMVEEVSGKAATFEVRLVSSQEYEFLLWADKSNDDNADNFYDTDGQNGLKEITASYTGYIGNDENRDAFYYYSKQLLPDTGIINASLTRPFAQVNVRSYLEDVNSTMYPTQAQITYSTPIATTFNMSADTASGADLSVYEDLTWSAAATFVSNESDVLRPYYDLTTDYLFAPADAQDVIDFTMDITLLNGTIVTNDSFNNIPIRRNYKTNISGELLTNKGTIKVSVSEDFSSEESDINVISNVTDLNTLLSSDENAASTTYVVLGEVDGTTEISIPATTATGASRSITLEDVADGATVTFTDENATNSSGSISELYITIEEGSNISISVKMPHSTVYINGTEIVDGEVWSSKNTTIIAADTKITGTLTVKQGNVEIYGEVNKIEIDSSNNAEGTITIFEGGSITNISESTFKSYTIKRSGQITIATIKEATEFIAVASGDIDIVVSEEISNGTIDIPSSCKASSITIETPNISDNNYLLVGSNTCTYTGDLTVKSNSPNSMVSIMASNANSATYSGEANLLTLQSGGDAILAEGSVVGGGGVYAILGDFYIYGDIEGTLNIGDETGEIYLYGDVTTISNDTSKAKSVYIGKDKSQPAISPSSTGAITFITIQNITTSQLHSTISRDR